MISYLDFFFCDQRFSDLAPNSDSLFAFYFLILSPEKPEMVSALDKKNKCYLQHFTFIRVEILHRVMLFSFYRSFPSFVAQHIFDSQNLTHNKKADRSLHSGELVAQFLLEV